MPLTLSHDTVKSLCVGMSGFGKTLKANELILRSAYRYYFIFDHDGQFAQRNKVRPALAPAQILAQLKTTRFVVFNPSELFDDPAEGFGWFCAYAYKISEALRGTKLLYCDEVQDIVGTNKIDRRVRKVFTSGRNRQLDFLGCSLQYNQVHNSIRGQITHTYAFFTNEDEALDKLRVRGFDPAAVASLPRFHYILRTNRGEETRGIVTPPR